MTRRRTIRVALRVLVVLLVGSVVSYGCADRLILGTNHDRVDSSGARATVVRRGDGRAIECWIARSPGAASKEPEAFVLFFVGKADRADRWITAVAGAWSERPVEVWGMN